MARTIVLSVAAAVLVASGWLVLERGGSTRVEAVVFLIALALAPALVRPVYGRALVAVAATVVAAGVAFERSPLDARPFDGGHDFVGPVLSDLRDGILQFYDVNVPFVPAARPLMDATVLIAIFAFSLLVALAVAARRPVLAALALLVGAAWPLTLVATSALARGGLLLAGVFALLAWARERPPQTLRPALVAGVVLVAAALAASTSAAVTKGNFLSWQAWDPYDQPDDAVGVRYVWDASYDGISFPKQKTVVLTVDAPQRAVYWRATTLDAFIDDRWVEQLTTFSVRDDKVDLPRNPLLPTRAYDGSDLLRADVTVKALRDRHLAGPSTPLAYDPNGIGRVQYRTGGVALLSEQLERGDRYTVWAYAPRPSPVELARSQPVPALRNTVHSEYLELAPGADSPSFGDGGRERVLQTLLESPAFGPLLRPYLPLYQQARKVVGRPTNPYTAVVALEAWFRSQGGFRYAEQPPQVPGAPPLVAFVTETKAGYCQHYAGAMALMLRWLGIPARVAVGFTSGTYDEGDGRWTVTDHNAHAWVEVWFDGWGWLPFDPTPGRGQLSGAYTTAAADFDTQSAQRALNLGGALGGPSFNVLSEFLRSRRVTGSTVTGRDVPGDILRNLPTRDAGSSLLKLLGLLGLGIVLAIAAAKLVIRRGRYLTRDPRRVAGACRAELVDFLSDQGVHVSRSATLADLGETVDAELGVDARPFVNAAGAARFAPPDQSGAAARRARRELRALLRLVRRRLSAVDRIRGLVSVRSLGLGS